MSQQTKVNQISCYNEFDPLRKVILCSPKYMKIREIINETQVHFAKDNINPSLAVKQHSTLINTLEQENIEVILLQADKKFPEQVFTRDLAFTFGNKIIIGQLDRTIRKGEETFLKKWLEEKDIPYDQIQSGSKEGGDVIIDNTTIWIGHSFRTSQAAIEELQHLLPDIEVIGLPFDGDYLHLDCVFNLISPEEGLIFSPAFKEAEIEILTKRYNLIRISPREQFTLGTNVLSIGNKKIISLPQNRKVNRELRSRGYQVIEVDISEIIKSGGSFRCITMPLLRK